MPGFFSIRAKFLAVMSALLLSCLIVYLLIAVEVFKTDKTELVFDLNRSMVTNLSTEFETEFKGISDKLRLFALLSTNPSAEIKNETIFGENSELVYASLYRQNKPDPLRNFTDKKYLETYGLESNFFTEKLSNLRPIPFNEILKNSEHFWNATVEGGAPLVGYGRNVIIEDSKGNPTEHIAVISYIKPDKILKDLSFVKLSEISIVDEGGRILIHSDFNVMKNVSSLQESPLFAAAITSKVKVSVASLTDGGGDFLGAFAKSYNGKVFVLARASKSQAFSAVYQLVSRSISFALVVITLSLFFAFLLSRSLTRPLSILVEGMEKVSAGDLSTRITVNSKDETQMLATSFNEMIRDLKDSRDDLQEVNRTLEQKVRDRTLQLAIQNQAVKEAQEALLKTTRLASAGEIAGRAAHEVLNPLTGILTRLSSIEKKLGSQMSQQITLMKDIFDSWRLDYAAGGIEKLMGAWQKPSQVDEKWNLLDEDLHNLSYVQQSFEEHLKTSETDTQFLLHEGRRISKIIGGMRTLSRLNSDVQAHSAKKLMTDCHNIMADLFSAQNIRIQENYDAGFDTVEIDRDEFIQAVTNLLRNSLQAMPELNPKINYSLKLSSQLENNHICIFICDNGCGVSEVHQKMLFEKQFTTKSADEGTGLGLGISRRFIRAHGGDIEFVSSIPFVETIFKITLPLKSEVRTINKEGAA